jgi:inosine/xanthosine triphosphate pyrophosphatase family protein
MSILFVTSDYSRFNYTKNILNNINIIQCDFEKNLIKIQGTIEEISKDKCIKAYNSIDIKNNYKGILVEEISLEIDIMNGLPGPYINNFMNKMSSTEISNTAMDIHWRLYAHSDKDWASKVLATYICIYTYYDKNTNKYYQFTDKIRGNIDIDAGDILIPELPENICDIFTPQKSIENKKALDLLKIKLATIF